MRIVLAIGGNMISNPNNKNDSFDNQVIRIKNTTHLIIELIKMGHEIIITHGNGPQVGSLLIQQETAGTIKLPLSILGALTQGQLGVLIQHNLINALNNNNITKEVFVLQTSVLVDKNDENFSNPTKPIGPFYTEEEFKKIKKGENNSFKQTKNGYRRVVASPKPIDILEKNLINQIIDNKNIAIAVGGGGTPCYYENGNGLKMLDAVIDKDLASALLANKINADFLIILTNIDGVYKNYGTENEFLVPELTVEEAEILLNSNQLGSGSMAPKVKAGIYFADFGNTLITSPEKLLIALKGQSGTLIKQVKKN